MQGMDCFLCFMYAAAEFVMNSANRQGRFIIR